MTSEDDDFVAQERLHNEVAELQKQLRAANRELEASRIQREEQLSSVDAANSAKLAKLQAQVKSLNKLIEVRDSQLQGTLQELQSFKRQGLNGEEIRLSFQT